MAALIIAIFPQNSSRGNWEEQQDRTDPNSQFELARKPAWLLAFRQFGLPKWKHDFESVPLWPLRYRSVSISACHSRRFQSTQKSFGEKSRRENIKVFDLEFWKPRISKGFRGDEIPRSRRNFECSSLQPLRYASMHKYSLFRTNHMISSQPRYDHFDTSPCCIFKALRVSGWLRTKCRNRRQSVEKP